MLLFFVERPSETLPFLREEVGRRFENEIRLEKVKSVIPSGWHCFLAFVERSIAREELTSLRRCLFSAKVDVLQIEHRIKNESLFCFDMDSTLIRQEVVDELARFAGVYDEVAAVTREAMEGNLNFQESLRKRCAYLRGLSADSLLKLYPRLTLNYGVRDLLSELKRRGAKLAVFSGGFTDILEAFQKDYEIDEVRANVLERIDGKLTGGVLGRIVDKDVKRGSLLELREKFGISKREVIAVGDGANDQLMLAEAGIGIGFHAKEGLKSGIENWVDFAPMDVLLYLFEG
ncbi:phosphoserine phosphatase SerB [Leptospira inadai serovar Lyme str. 10]|uniref:Phosphoserine phosphatase n=2 Tax=Leptospira inadai serovar Lyme TaxID=293084 RepID=V6HW21_9LEPT|nr:phosphoserine phosphatase SerB [Leptospira inadai]EQA37104.1 phosphoserine phosphatase SerB [Leptospira inadai serovar Lyme str. 10]PNV76608.1 phosphoserine phosphatase SerB [Leptospira inadai serovar Lyme]